MASVKTTPNGAVTLSIHVAEQHAIKVMAYIIRACITATGDLTEGQAALREIFQGLGLIRLLFEDLHNRKPTLFAIPANRDKTFKLVKWEVVVLGMLIGMVANRPDMGIEDEERIYLLNIANELGKVLL